MIADLAPTPSQVARTTLAEDAMDLDGFDRFDFASNGTTKVVYRRGQGPGVILMHELPGMVPECVELARAIAAANYTVYLPLFFGRPKETRSIWALAPEVIGACCIRREFTLLSRGRTSPIVTWLRDLARHVRAEAGGTAIGAIGMCLTGGFALALLLNKEDGDGAVSAPVLCQPSLPVVFPCSRTASREDLGLDPGQLARVKERVVREGIPLLGFHFREDRISPKERFARLRREFGDHFLEHQLPGKDHSVLTLHFRRLSEADQDAVWTTLIGFLNDRLKGGQGLIPPKPAPPRQP